MLREDLRIEPGLFQTAQLERIADAEAKEVEKRGGYEFKKAQAKKKYDKKRDAAKSKGQEIWQKNYTSWAAGSTRARVRARAARGSRARSARRRARSAAGESIPGSAPRRTMPT